MTSPPFRPELLFRLATLLPLPFGRQDYAELAGVRSEVDRIRQMFGPLPLMRRVREG